MEVFCNRALLISGSRNKHCPIVTFLFMILTSKSNIYWKITIFWFVKLASQVSAVPSRIAHVVNIMIKLFFSLDSTTTPFSYFPERLGKLQQATEEAENELAGHRAEMEVEFQKKVAEVLLCWILFMEHYLVLINSSWDSLYFVFVHWNLNCSHTLTEKSEILFLCLLMSCKVRYEYSVQVLWAHCWSTTIAYCPELPGHNHNL